MAADMTNCREDEEIDDSLYSRQRYVLGDAAMRLMASSRVFLHGLGGVGIEIAKNLILAGVKELVVEDNTVCTVQDLATQFFIRQSDVDKGLTRAVASLPRLAELNPYVTVTRREADVSLLVTPISASENVDVFRELKQFQCVIVTQCLLKTVGILDTFCRQEGIKFLFCDVYGVFGTVFCDFGPSFRVTDQSGEEAKEFFVGNISNGNPGIMTVLDNRLHDLENGDVIQFKEVVGITQLNGASVTVKVVSPYKLAICDTSHMGKYAGGGIATQVKQPGTIAFHHFLDQCYRPSLVTADLAKLDDYLQLHMCYLTLLRFLAEKSRLPRPWDKADLKEFLLLSDDVCNGLGISAMNIDLVTCLVMTSSGCLPPLCAFFGGVAAQEALKAITGKFTPLQQWLYLDCREVVPSSLLSPTQSEYLLLLGDRYDPIRICIGQQMLERLSDFNAFMVGCGAIGCELLKNLALLGVSCGGVKTHANSRTNDRDPFRPIGDESAATLEGSKQESGPEMDTDTQITLTAAGEPQVMPQSPDPAPAHPNQSDEEIVGSGKSGQIYNGPCGRIVITDMDLIEKSNLNRQFLFRSHHIQRPKSVTAAAAALEMNPDMRIEAHQHRVGPSTEKTVYSDTFFRGLNVCLNALDNVETRRYTDARCVTNRCPLLESGTLGTKGHVQVVVPGLTENYGSQMDAAEVEIAYCTLKSFPATIEHCIEWGRDKFASQFALKPDQCQRFWATPGHTVSTVIASLSAGQPPQDVCHVARWLKSKPANWTDCVRLARAKFNKYFNHKARQLLHTFPTTTTLEDGSPFWQLPKRQPTPIEFNINDELHLQFLQSCARLLADVAGIPHSPSDVDPAVMASQLDGFVVAPFVPANKKIETDEKAGPTDKSQAVESADAYERASAVLHVLSGRPDWVQRISNCRSLQFEKDDDANGHIDFITSASNLRARMYGIEEVNRYKVKKIAGRIVPAIATTTAAISGLVALELIKLCLDTRQLEQYRNSFLNLALPVFVMSEPGPCKRHFIGNGHSFTLWDRWVVAGSPQCTLAMFLEKLKTQYGLLANMVLQESRMIYVNYLPGHQQRLQQTLLSLLKVCPTDTYVDLFVTYERPIDQAVPTGDAEEVDNDVQGPPVRYYLRGK